MKCENKNLTQFFLFVRDWDRKGLGLKSDQDYFVYEINPDTNGVFCPVFTMQMIHFISYNRSSRSQMFLKIDVL